jgi:hypothetical protein
VSFSGGKDSTVLLHIARQIYPGIPAVFSNTGLEYPEIQKFVKSFDNVDIVTPAMNFAQVISVYGYPLIGKEVADAIYYARRIRSQSSNVERERAGQRSENSGNSPVRDATKRWSREKNCYRTVTIQGGEITSQSQTETRNAGQQKNQFIETGASQYRRAVLTGRLREAETDPG